MSCESRRTGPRLAALWVAACLGLAALFPAGAAAQSYTWKNVQIVGGGYVPGLVFSTKEKNLIYARTDMGTAYRWDQTSARWIPLLDWMTPDNWNWTGVESIATDPVDSNKLYLVVGTYTNEWTDQNGAVLRSNDKGKTFLAPVPLPFKAGGNMPGRNMGERLAVDPNQNSILYFGARSGNGLWRSTDSGATWAKVSSFPNPGTYFQDSSSSYTKDLIGVTWVTFDPRSGSAGSATRTIYVGVADKGTSIYRSTDGGATWAALPGQPTGFLPQHGVLSSTGVLYVTYSNGGGPYDGSSGDVWRFDTATSTWKLISPVPSTNTADDYFGYGGVAVDAQHPDTVMVSALNSWWPDTIFWRSLDGGTTWTKIWDWTSYPSRSLRYTLDISAAPWLTFGKQAIDPVPSPQLGWMVGDLEIDPFDSDRLMYGTGATIYGCTNLTAWDAGGKIALKVMAQGIEETAVLGLISPPAGPPLVSAVGDIDGFVHTDLDKVPATMNRSPNLSSARDIDFAELSPGFMVRVGDSDRSITPVINRAGFTYAAGSSWFQANAEPSGTSGGGTVAAAADASRVVWAPAGAAVSFSTDNGNSWTASTGIAREAMVRSDRVNPKRFYGFSGADSTFYASTNGGVSFTAAAKLTGVTAARFRAVPGVEGDLWLAGGTAGLFHSTDGGVTFTKVTGVARADDIGYGKAAPGRSYAALYLAGAVGGVRAIYRSDDAAATWVRINDDAHAVVGANAILTGDPRVYGRVYVGTNGRGIFYGDLGSTPTSDFSISLPSAQMSVTPGAAPVTATVTVARTGSFTGAVALTATGAPSGVTLSFSPASATGTTSTLSLSSATGVAAGTYAVTVTGTSGALVHTVPLTLTVNASGFALAVTPTSVSVTRGSSATATVQLALPAGGSPAGTVALSASGLPSGVTATFSPATITSTSTLTLAASSTATLGTSTVTVTGSNGSSTASARLQLIVAGPTTGSIALSASPATVSVARGASGSSTVAIARTNFTGAVTLSATGLPSGVAIAYGANPTTGNSSTVTFTAASTAATGAATVTITGTGTGVSASASTTIGLTVTGGTSTAPCENATTFTGNTNTFNTTGAVCYRTSATINGWGCYNMEGRTLQVNNAAVTCGAMPLPAKWSDGFTYFAVTAGTYPWAGIYAW
jgi:xyloglucan-specific exo-beta-1,4-glucanase